MRGKTLQECLRLLRIRLGQSPVPAHGQQTQESLTERLTAAQEWLWETYEWEHLDVDRDIQMQAGQRYYDAPDDVDAEQIHTVSYRSGNEWCELEYGIGPEHMATFNSDAGVRSNPIHRWQWAENPSDPHVSMIEVWPVPATNGDPATLDGYVRVEGKKKLEPFSQLAHKCTLDHRLIVGHAAIPLLAKKGSREAEREAAELDRLRLTLQGRGSANARMSFADCDEDPDRYRHRRFLHVTRTG